MHLVEAGLFRSDWYYRLDDCPITVPPLRERREDIPVLVRYFAQRYATRMKKSIETIPTKTMDRLVRYHWPGKIRELGNLIERAVILSPGSELSVRLPEIKTAISAQNQPLATLEVAEREHILRAYETRNG